MIKASSATVLGLALVVLAACSDSAGPDRGCTGSCANVDSRLQAAEVLTVISQAVAEAAARDAAATIAVVDRVGNVLGVYRMAGAAEEVTARTTLPGEVVSGGLEEVSIIPDSMAAIAKAATAAFLSTEGNAFTTRTASQIVQDHFNPGEINQPGGPLFGVQFSQLPCSDFMLRGDTVGAGPRRSPLGMAADPGGLPLYRDGVPVGAVGVIADGIYGLDRNITAGLDNDLDELIALAATRGLEAPAARRADTITADGKVLRFTDASPGQLRSRPIDAALALAADGGALIAVPGYTDGTVVAGTAFGQPESGVRPATGVFAALDGFVLVDDADQVRFPPTASTVGQAPLSAEEVEVLLFEALSVANRARGQIRRPLGQPARVSITVVDTAGTILGQVRGRDAPIFGLDVSVQKARTATFFSNPDAAAQLRALPATEYIVVENGEIQLPGPMVVPGDYVDAVRAFLGLPGALADGAFAFADRSGGNLSRPYYPDGIDGNPAGPLSKPAGQWSVFSVGLQTDLIYNALIQHVAFVGGLGGVTEDVAPACTGVAGISAGFERRDAVPGLGNGIQIFPGSVPIYRGNQLVGGIGVSGDGVDQDDMISFLGLHQAGERLGTINNAPPDMRADRIVAQGNRLRYINCPQNPFIDTTDQDVCNGK